jgi:Nucleotide modification associated domain 2
MPQYQDSAAFARGAARKIYRSHSATIDFMVKKPDYYVYKLTSDNGGAPCVHGNMLSLAICKPRIRSTAEIGSFIVGIGGKPLGGRLIYIACINGKVVDGLYYHATCFRRRPDCIYENVAGHAKIRRGTIFHKEGDQTKRDVGVQFEDAEVLLSHDFRYFGQNGTTDWKKCYSTLSEMVEELEIGHRRNHNEGVYNDLCKLRADIWNKYPENLNSKPTEKAENKLLNDDTPSVLCSRRR